MFAVFWLALFRKLQKLVVDSSAIVQIWLSEWVGVTESCNTKGLNESIQCLVTGIWRTFGRIGMLRNTSSFTYCSAWFWPLMQPTLWAEVCWTFATLASDFKWFPASLSTAVVSLMHSACSPLVCTWECVLLRSTSLVNTNLPSNILLFKWMFEY